MIDENRLKILTESAKYDVSCSSSGSRRTNTKDGIGNASFGGICHSFTPDGRCISLLKILMSNKCCFNCLYCPSRAEADVPRASATPDEICELVISFYKRNYIEGLFLSSAVDGSPDATMERMLDTVVRLRTVYKFNGYIHLKGIPRADPILTRRAALYADRMSYNVELPSEQSLKLLAPQKSKESVLLPMKQLAAETRANKVEKSLHKQKFLPAGQTTQMIVGASPEADGQILRLSEALYRRLSLKRVYYSSYIPVVKHSLLPDRCTGLLREHRLYQADWLMRFYGFTAEEIAAEGENLPEEYDPKCAWALKNMQYFPVEINSAPLEALLRVPGIGTLGAYKIIKARKYTPLGFEDLAKMRIVLKRAKHFITCKGKFFGCDRERDVRTLLALADGAQKYEQLSMFSQPEISLSALTGQL
ncbi:MAG TPA: putative DNA modification/repair radical SAM protein [Candidatus Borkfalkia excrementavium]|uniref:DNA modification/repair radical SAM protein n=1 Tax=Candidatus Borkfalkia excrementavium TaxID=2838505 RepID=A0A9D2CFV3_9FIRM|nr:putative DNA modification/repair radical SAM protein [Candidatus Borkfalkia excrementavium]